MPLSPATVLQVSDPGAGVMGAGAHTDWGLMTLLATVRAGPETRRLPTVILAPVSQPFFPAL